MYSKKVTIKNSTGLHARPATQLVHLAEKYNSNLTVKREDTDEDVVGDIKSIFSILSIGLEAGAKILVKGEGDDEVEAVDAVCNFISSLED